MKPLAPQRYSLQLTMNQSTHDKLRYAQELLGHQVPSGDVAEVLDRALDALIAKLEKRKFAATPTPRTSRRSAAGGRYIPADIKRTVWQRDGGRCTFVSDAGQRCPARTRLEFDHIEAVARGGEASVAGIRLRCHAHNQYTAECEFGVEFMRHKREARREAAKAQAQERESAAAETRARVPQTRENGPTEIQPAEDHDVILCLRRLGFRAEEARHAASVCATMPDATLEQRVRTALSLLRPNARHRPAPAA